MLRWSAPHVGSTVVVANLTSEKESDIRPRPVELVAGGGAGAVAAKVPDAHAEWAQWLALVAALVLAFDVWWLTRSPRAASSASLSAIAPRRGVS
jgi:hypothetical protein